MKSRVEQLWAFVRKYQLVFLVLAAGIVLLLWPGSGGGKGAAQPEKETQGWSDFDLEALEQKLERVLERIEGAGEVCVALTVRDGVERVFASDTSCEQRDGGWEEETKTVVISTGSGTEEVVVVQQRYPAFRGAVVVCQGGGDPEIRLLITRAVSALTGLGSDRISVCKSK